MTSSLHPLISFDNTVFSTYVFWLCVLCFKMLLMAPLTAFHRVATNTYPNPEDAALHGLKTVTFGNPRVERVRRAHRNDLESIVPLLLVEFVYVLTDPAPAVATNAIRVAAIFRIVHTLVYAVWVMPQPTRAICFAVPILVNTYMAVHTLVHCLQ